MKLDVSRSQDVADTSRMVGWASNKDLKAVREVIARYSPQDSEDLESMIYLGRKEQELPD